MQLKRGKQMKTMGMVEGFNRNAADADDDNRNGLNGYESKNYVTVA